MYENCKVYGPYAHTDGNRKIVILIFPDGKRKTTAYAKYLWETVNNTEVPTGYEVDHKDNNSLNDSIDNLQLLLKEKNIRKSTKTAETMIFECPVCFGLFELEARRYRANQLVKGKAGPYCSKSCSGKIHH